MMAEATARRRDSFSFLVNSTELGGDRPDPFRTTNFGMGCLAVESLVAAYAADKAIVDESSARAAITAHPPARLTVQMWF